jgi:hypothetical protein
LAQLHNGAHIDVAPQERLGRGAVRGVVRGKRIASGHAMKHPEPVRGVRSCISAFMLKCKT